MSPAYDPTNSRLHLTPAGLDAVVATARSRELDPGPGGQELIDIGVVEALVSEESTLLTSAMEAWQTSALVEMALTYDGQTAQVWASMSTAVVALPLVDGEHEVRIYPVTTLPLALARLVELRPLDRADGPQPLEEIADVHRHWVLESRWTYDGRTGGQTLEVLDDGRSWWLVHREDERPWGLPSDGAAILGRITHMIMRRDLTGI